jgi:hypothetical protein
MSLADAFICDLRCYCFFHYFLAVIVGCTGNEGDGFWIEHEGSGSNRCLPNAVLRGRPEGTFVNVHWVPGGLGKLICPTAGGAFGEATEVGRRLPSHSVSQIPVLRFDLVRDVPFLC